ncbi:hypothetical protein CRG98_024193 [Punica granatum]|uniref:Uncharacterized protein n=1 Tax=Punica granatum TaxID=22663 RepID=A0A2I0JHL9_PUNGR|nr:hypothetical protein CRG98_024193 [Punica granatum]
MRGQNPKAVNARPKPDAGPKPESNKCELEIQKQKMLGRDPKAVNAGVGKRTSLVGIVQAHRGACIGTHMRCADGACMWYAVTHLYMLVVDRPLDHSSSCLGGRVKIVGGLLVMAVTTRLPCGVGGRDGLSLWSQRILLWRSEDRG